MSSDLRSRSQPTIVGGGAKKILYTLSTVKRIGLLDSAKALRSRNTCKACGLGMGGQYGGMTNEMDEFPSVCNKSIQAQSTDIQQPIPVEVFEHPVAEFRKLSGREMETLGRLNTPLYKAKDSDHLKPISWEDALNYAVSAFSKTTPEKSFFYSSGRSSNEAGFVLQLFARAFGTNNVNNCSYYCHQATGVGLSNAIGSGTATIELADLKKTDLVFVIGANPASNHPRFIHQLLACRERGGHVIVINPAKEPGLVKFAVPKNAKSMLKGGSDIASAYLQPKIGSDAALMIGIAKVIMEIGAADHQFIFKSTDNFSEYEAFLQQINWPQIETQTGLSRTAIEEVAALYAKSKNTVFAWGMGITHHLHGVDNVEAIANLALLRGMVGKPGAGLLPLRGHSNVQGIGTIGVKPVLADDVWQSLQKYFPIKTPQHEGLDTLGCLHLADEGQVDVALIMGGNLFEATPDTGFAERVFNKIGCKIFMTTTLNRGHFRGIDEGETIILPVCARDEERQSTTQESMFNFVRLSDGGITRLDNVRPEVDIICDIAAKVLPDHPLQFDQWNNHHTLREAIAKVVPGMEALAAIDSTQKEFHVKNRLMHSANFQTASKRAIFNPHQWQVTSSSTEFPFLLSSVRSEGQFNSIIYEESDSYRDTTHRWIVFLCAEDIEQLKIQKGAYVDIESAVGAMRMVQVQEFDLPRGNVMAYYPEANALIGTACDPRSKTPAFKSVPVKLVVRAINA